MTAPVTTHRIKASALALFNTPEFHASSSVLGGYFKSLLGIDRSYELLTTTDGSGLSRAVASLLDHEVQDTGGTLRPKVMVRVP